MIQITVRTLVILDVGTCFPTRRTDIVHSPHACQLHKDYYVQILVRNGGHVELVKPEVLLPQLLPLSWSGRRANDLFETFIRSALNIIAVVCGSANRDSRVG